ncbi:MAG: hypothetical protein ACR2LR_00920 [Hassallia sp.]
MPAATVTPERRTPKRKIQRPYLKPLMNKYGVPTPYPLPPTPYTLFMGVGFGCGRVSKSTPVLRTMRSLFF